MGFRLFGVDVEIQFGFWLTALLLGYLGRGSFDPAWMAVWVGIVLVSVLVHEYGHAFAIKRHQIEPEITLHGMGGTTRWRALLPLKRLDHVIISVAGPFAGFVLAAAAYSFLVLGEDLVRTFHPLARFAVHALVNVNLYWGIINLAPVLPFDGGHVLEHALGPKRARLTAIISLVAGAGITIWFVQQGQYWGALIFGMSALQSFQQYRAQAPTRPTPSPKEQRDEVPPEASALLRSARQALADDQLDRAIALAEQVLSGSSDPASHRASVAALEVIAWAHHMAGRLELAEETVRRAGILGPVDAALGAALLLARGEQKEARKLLEQARARGDDRKEIVGPLIQVLLEQREVARAAAVAYDVVDTLSEDDIRQMASLSFDAGVFEWAGRLWEAAFAREGAAEDAYGAARARAKNGETDRALELLRKAVAAGFSDRARAWSDAALSSLQADARHLQAVLPRP